MTLLGPWSRPPISRRWSCEAAASVFRLGCRFQLSFKWILWVLAKGTFPSITTLECTNFDNFGWRFLLDLNILPQLTELTITGPIHHIGHIPALLDRLTSLVTLDIASAKIHYFAQLLADPHRCPALRRLRVCREDLTYLTTYVVMRAVDSASAFSCLMYFPSISHVYNTNILVFMSSCLGLWI
ncbi:hypothetical protein B0H16DRAFT_1521450 [Mycena metata]|uniref:F-box domain-containing protein n=1 Tax=Mycena metata TaxID=1033252 RepID=A0AAD7JQB8_9AGAR|nr:hypothetical protein B0H16DRAFT_1521450 [Mycena metata]